MLFRVKSSFEYGKTREDVDNDIPFIRMESIAYRRITRDGETTLCMDFVLGKTSMMLKGLTQREIDIVKIAWHHYAAGTFDPITMETVITLSPESIDFGYAR